MLKFLKGKKLMLSIIVLMMVVVAGQSLYAIGTNPIENYQGAIKFNAGTYTELPITSIDTITGATLTDGTITITSGVISGITSMVTSAISAVTGTFSGVLTANGGLLHSSVNATSTTATTQDLLEADLLNYETVIMTPNTGSVTFTPVASSSVPNLVPTAGDWVTQKWFNATTTAGIDIIFAVTTGWDIGTSSPASTTLTIGAGEWGTITYQREPATATTFDIGLDFSRSSE